MLNSIDGSSLLLIDEVKTCCQRKHCWEEEKEKKKSSDFVHISREVFHSEWGVMLLRCVCFVAMNIHQFSFHHHCRWLGLPTQSVSSNWHLFWCRSLLSILVSSLSPLETSNSDERCSMLNLEVKMTSEMCELNSSVIDALRIWCVRCCRFLFKSNKSYRVMNFQHFYYPLVA